MSVDEILTELGGRFVDVEPLAKGRTGASFRARDEEQGRAGVLKILHADQARGSDGMRLKRELARQLGMSHPNLALPTATGEAGGRLWLFRDYVEGESLEERLAREGSLPVTEALAIIAQIASGLDELHRGGMLHRDLQPAHVMLSGEADELPKVVLIDASVAPPIDAAPALDLRGTPEYVSPEQAKGKLVSFRSDLYSLGCVLHELLTGDPPFTGDVATVLDQHAKAPAPPPPDSLPDGGKLLASLLAKEPRERPFSAQQVRRTLDSFLPEALRKGAAGEPRRAVPGGAVPAPAVPKKTLVGVPPVARGAGASGGGVPAPAEAPDPGADWQDDHTQQIDAQDLLEVAQPAQPKVSVPPPAPGATAKVGSVPPPAPGATAKVGSVPPPAPGATAKVGSVPPPAPGATAPPGRALSSAPPPAPSSVPPPVPASASARPSSGGPDPSRPLPKGPPVPLEHRDSHGAPPLGAARPPTPVLTVALGAFLLGAVLSGTVVYLMMAGDGGPEVALGAAHESAAPPAPDVPAPPEDTRAEASPTGDPAGEGEAEGATGADEDPLDADEAADDEALAEATDDEALDDPEEGDEEPSVEAAPQASAQAQAAERQRRLQAQRRAQAARRRQQARQKASSGKTPFDQAQEDAREAFRKRDYAAAARAYERATKIRPRHAGSFAGLGAARLAKGDARGAVKAYEQAARLQPRHAGFQVALGRARERAGDRAGAKRAYQQALSIDSNNAAAKSALQKL